MPDLDAEVDAALRDSIKRFGVLEAVAVDQHGNIIDGHNRVRIAHELNVSYDTKVHEVADEAEALELARTLNLDRRHMSPVARRQLIVALAQNGHSATAIAGAVGVSDDTVHRDLAEADVQVSHDAKPVPLPEKVTGTDGKQQPRKKKRWTSGDLLALLLEFEGGATRQQLADEHGVGVGQIAAQLTAARKLRSQQGGPALTSTLGKSPDAVAAREAKCREMAEAGHTSRQIAAALGVHIQTVKETARRIGVTIAADAVAGNTRRIDSNRIVGETVHTLEGAVMGASLVDFDDLDRDQIAGWVTSLNDSLRSLNQLNKRLKEMTRDEA